MKQNFPHSGAFFSMCITMCVKGGKWKMKNTKVGKTQKTVWYMKKTLISEIRPNWIQILEPPFIPRISGDILYYVIETNFLVHNMEIIMTSLS